MDTELQVKNIHQRLHSVMEAIKYVQKEDKMVNGQYRFVSHDAVSALIRPELVKQGILLITSVKSYKQEGNRTEVNLELIFCNIDSPDDKIIFNAFGYGIDNQDKGPGKAISYAVKYALLKMFCLETGDDPEKSNIDYVDKSADYSLPGEYSSLIENMELQAGIIKNVDDTNEMLEDLASYYDHIKDSKARGWRMLQDKAKKLKLVFNKELGKFEYKGDEI